MSLAIRSIHCEYFGRYAACEQWAFAAGVVDGRAAMLVYDRDVSLETLAYFVASV
jgi:RNA polymerase sigma-70 factor (ECF subfamily)